MARAPGDRLRAPGRRLGVALVDAPRHRARPRRRGDGDRARRARDGRRRARGVPRRHGRPHHGGARAPSPPSRWPSCARWTSRTGGSPAPTSRRAGRPASTRSAAGRRGTRRSASPPLREVLERFPGVVLNLDIKQTAPVVAPYEEALARLLAEFGRTDDVIVASFLDPATDAFRRFAPAVPTSAGTMATAEAWRAVQAGEDAARHRRRWPSRCPSARATWWWWTSGSWRRRTRPARRSTCGRSTTPSRWSGCSTSGVDGIISDVPDDAVRRAGRAGRGLGRALSDRALRAGRRRVSAAAAVRLLAVVGLLLGPELALDRSLRHGREPRRRSAGRSGSLGCDAVRMAAAGRRRGVRARDDRLAGRARRVLRGRTGCEGALHVEGARTVHTVGMKFPVDVAFLSADLTVVRVARLRPWRLAVGGPGRPQRRRDRGRLARALGRAGGRPARGARGCRTAP